MVETADIAEIRAKQEPDPEKKIVPLFKTLQNMSTAAKTAALYPERVSTGSSPPENATERASRTFDSTKRSSRADEQSAAVCADAEIVNELDERVIGTLTASLKLCGSDEESVVFARVPAAMEAHEKKTFYLNGMIGKPKLWSCESPSLYELCISFEKEDENVIVLDKERVGIRTFSFDADQGFFLNGKETKFKGVCVHHDGGCCG